MSEAFYLDILDLIEFPDVPISQLALAHFNRGLNQGILGDETAAVADYSAAIKLSNAPDEYRAKAYHHRGLVELEKPSTLLH